MTYYEKMKQLFTELGITFDEYVNDRQIIQKHNEHYILHYFNLAYEYFSSNVGINK